MTTTHKVRFGIQFRLFAAIGSILTLLGLTAAAAWIAFSKVDQAVTGLNQNSIPTIVNTLKLANTSTQAASLAPLINAAQSEEELSLMDEAFTQVTADLAQKIETLKSLATDPTSLDAATQAQASLVEQEKTLKATSLAQIQLQAQLNTLIMDLVFAYADLEDFLTPIMEVNEMETSRAMRSLSNDGGQTDLSGLKSDLNNARALGDIKANGNLAFGMLIAAISVPPGDAMDEIQSKFDWAALRLDKALSKLDSNDEQAKLQGLVAKMLSYGEGAKGVFDLRAVEWKNKARQAELLTATKELADQMNALTATLVAQQEAQSKGDATLTTQTISNAKLILLAMGLVALAISCAIVVLYIRGNLIRRLLHAIENMRAIAEGNFDRDVETSGRDEITQMNQMLKTFCETGQAAAQANQRILDEREKAQEERRKQMHALASEFESSVSVTLNHSNEAAVTIHASSENVARKAAANSVNSTNIASATEQTTVSIETVSSAAQALEDKITEVGNQAAQALQITETAVDESQNATQLVESLAEAASEIGNIVTLITDIAGQTNLLALNATIEAARAGDAGKGFAVVASEVKGLADQTAKATEEIGKRISGIQGCTDSAVHAIASITRSIDAMHDSAEGMSQAIGSQQGFVSEIADNVGQVSIAMRDVTTNISAVRDAAQENTDDMERIVKSAKDLMDLSTTIQSSADDFIAVIRA